MGDVRTGRLDFSSASVPAVGRSAAGSFASLQYAQEIPHVGPSAAHGTSSRRTASRLRLDADR